MTNITKFTQDKQIMVSEHQLRRLLEFVTTTELKIEELQTLIHVSSEKSKDNSQAKTLLRVASGLAMDFREVCSEELDFFKECSPELVVTFSKELAA